MHLRLIRRWFSDKSTISELFIDSDRECFILEDPVRALGVKIPGRTAIPAGTYRVVVTRSNRFKRELPLLIDVPGFDGIRIHPGNKPEDTEGCLLTGTYRGVDWVGLSRKAFDSLFAKIQEAVQNNIDVAITITNEQ